MSPRYVPPGRFTYWVGNSIHAKHAEYVNNLSHQFWASPIAARALDAGDPLNLDAALRLWVASPEGLNATWDDFGEFEALYRAVRGDWPLTGVVVVPGEAPPASDPAEGMLA